MPRTANGPARRWALLAAALATVLLVSGCGGDDESTPAQPADDQALVEKATVKIERAAAESADRVRDRNIPGRKRFKVVCLSSEEARAKNVSSEFIQCHVEAFSKPSKQRPQSVYIESEDWRVQAEPGGTVSEPVIVDGYRIRYFLRKDNKLGCSVGKTPQERCKTPFAEGP